MPPYGPGTSKNGRHIVPGASNCWWRRTAGSMSASRSQGRPAHSPTDCEQEPSTDFAPEFRGRTRVVVTQTTVAEGTGRPYNYGPTSAVTVGSQSQGRIRASSTSPTNSRGPTYFGRPTQERRLTRQPNAARGGRRCRSERSTVTRLPAFAFLGSPSPQATRGSGISRPRAVLLNTETPSTAADVRSARRIRRRPYPTRDQKRRLPIPQKPPLNCCFICRADRI